ncbi:DUF2812 domain-containing protein [Clostridium sp. NSJ-6]|uniref:DUF2812 domain-containing protein n=1 Tax=Clostridium hominis TaxID=2763036 RepID=A0ABR7DCG5_9CLOT|nr:DUF2812 domain-containing protein [Clostridium hominis]MBC5629062.1 DUF2812 domain-containing protein [Clostridium hominis]MDU2671878.1 DUF2812 domain-containing protein [Clostridium sp.]
MRIGSKKWVLFKFVPYEYKVLEKYLEKMALKGWMLEGMVGFFLKFIKIEPKALKYSVDVMDKIPMILGGDSKSAVECREYCEAAGWKFICQMEKIQIYCKENEVYNIPIQTDEEEKYKSIFKASLKYSILNILCVSMLLYSQYLTSFGNVFPEFLADNSKLLLLLLLSLWFIQDSVQFIHFIIWSITGRLRLKRNEPISYDFKAITGIKLVLNKIMFILLVAMLCIIILSGLLGKHLLEFLIVLTLSILAGIILFKVIKKITNKDETRKLINISIVILIVIINLIIYSRMTITIGINGILGDNNDYGSYSLALKDFDMISAESYGEKKESVLVYCEHYIEDDENSYISYYLYRSRYNFIIDYVLNKEFEKINRYDNEEVIIMESNIPDNIKVYKSINEDKFILVSDNTFISLYINRKDLDGEEVINIIYDKVFKSAS